MLKRYSACAIATLLLAGSLVSGVSGQSGSGQFELISATPAGVPAGGQTFLEDIPYDRGPQKISADNRFVVFASPSNQLVAGDTNGRQDIFVRDRTNGTTALVSRAFDGSLANGDSGNPRISANGRYVAFVSLATNLVASPDTNGSGDVFVRDLQTGITARVSVSTAGAEANYGGYAPAISADGRFIAFASAAQTLADPEQNVFNNDVFVRDTVAGTTQRVSVLPNGAHLIGSDSAEPAISADGRRIAFVVWDNTLGGPTPQVRPNLHEGVYVRDLDTGQLILASARPDGTPADLLVSLNPAISGNGRYVTFTNWEDLDPNFPDSHLENDGPYADVFLRDLQNGTTERISLPFPGGPDEESGGLSTVSGDGRYVAYLSQELVRIRDRVAGTTTTVLAPGGAVPDGFHESPGISEDGRFVYFESWASNIAPGDANGIVDTFVFSIAPMADLSLTLTASHAQPASGSAVTFTITLTNNGPSDTADAAVRVALPPGVAYVSDDGAGAYSSATGVWTAGSIAAASSTTLQIVGQFTATSPVTVIAQVSASSVTDPDSTPDNNNPAEDDHRSVVLTPQIADLSLTLAANSTAPPINSNVTFTATLTNSGPGSATGVRVSVPLPPGLTFVSSSPAAVYDPVTGVWTPGLLPVGVTIPSGAILALQVVARVTSPAAADVVADVAAADQPDPDSTPGNGIAAEDDYGAVRITPMAAAGIIVNNALMTVNPNDGTCTLVEAIVAANTDLPSGNALGECAGGNGPDTIYLRALNAPKDFAGVRDEYRVTAVHNTLNGPNGLPSVTSVVTLDGGGAAVARVSAAYFRLFHVSPGASLALVNVAVTGGVVPAGLAGLESAGGGVLNLGTLALNNASMSANVAGCDGGAVASLGPLSIRSSEFLSNTAYCSGGAIETFYAGQLEIVDSLIRSNSAPAGSGGGVMVHGTTTATLTNVTVDANTALSEGGGLLAHNADANVSIASSRFTNNVVTAGYGGAIANGRLQPGNSVTVLVAGGTMSVTNTTISGNRSTGSGGGIVNAGTLSVATSTVVANRITPAAGFACGGGIFSLDTVTVMYSMILTNSAEGAGRVGGGVCAYLRAAITNSTINGNIASTGGGLALVSVAAGLVKDSTISVNQATTDAGGGIMSQGFATLTLDHVVLQQNTARAGGGLWASATSIEARDVRLLGNTAAQQGGGVAFFGASTLAMTGGLIDGNVSNGLWSAVGGGGGLAIHAGATATLDGVAISNNRAPSGGDGGGIFNQGLLTVSGGELTGNSAESGGALANGTSLAQGGSVTLANVTVQDNVATSLGGAIFVANLPAAPTPSLVTLSGSTIRNNRAPNGAGIFSRPNSTVAVGLGTLISGNVATGQGGAIYTSGSLNVTDATLSGNTADVGGAIFSVGPSAITRSTISGNAARVAAGVRVVDGITSITTSTLSGNIGTLDGAGAIQVTGIAAPPAGVVSGRVNLQASTVVGNVGNPGGLLNGGYVQIVNTILAGNRRPDGTVSECTYGITGVFQYGSNLVGSDAGCGIGAVHAGALNRVVDPALTFTRILGPLANNGGPTATHALLAGSFATDAAFDCSADSDQRGESRPVDGDGDGIATCDVGAYELQSVLPAPPPTIAALSPATRLTGSPATTIVITGSGFSAGSVAYWNGTPRATFVRSPHELAMTALVSDFAAVGDITTALVTVLSPGTGPSNPLPFMLIGPRVITLQAQIAPPGTTVTASNAPLVATLHGVSATLTNNDLASTPATVAVASYSTNPADGIVFAAGGFFDLQVTGADPTDSLNTRFYYPTTVTGAAETSLQLQYWNGAAWAPVIGSGGALPLKDATNNLDGTVSGGRFTVTLDNSSTPRITELSGTIFALVEVSDSTPPATRANQSPEANARGWNNTDVTVALTATDDRSAVARTEFSVNGAGWRPYGSPIRFAAEGVYTLRFRSVDTAGNVEEAKTLRVRIDRTAPLFAVVAVPAVLPANKKLVDVFVLPLTLDLFSGADGVTLVGVTSSDPATTPDDIQGWTAGTADTHGLLRGERTPTGGSRIYTLTYRSVDRAGNAALATTTVRVPGARDRD